MIALSMATAVSLETGVAEGAQKAVLTVQKTNRSQPKVDTPRLWGKASMRPIASQTSSAFRPVMRPILADKDLTTKSPGHPTQAKKRTALAIPVAQTSSTKARSPKANPTASGAQARRIPSPAKVASKPVSKALPAPISVQPQPPSKQQVVQARQPLPQTPTSSQAILPAQPGQTTSVLPAPQSTQSGPVGSLQQAVSLVPQATSFAPSPALPQGTQTFSSAGASTSSLSPQASQPFQVPQAAPTTGTLTDTYTATPAAPQILPQAATPAPSPSPVVYEAQRLVADLNTLIYATLTPAQETAITSVYFLISSYIGAPCVVGTLEAASCAEIAKLLQQFLNPALAVPSAEASGPLWAQLQAFLSQNPSCQLVPQAQAAVVFLAQALGSQDPATLAAAKTVLRAYIQLCLDLVQRKCLPDLMEKLATIQMQVPLAVQRDLSEGQKKALKAAATELSKVYNGSLPTSSEALDAINRTLLDKILGVNLTQQEIVPEIFWAFSLVASTLGSSNESLRLAALALLETLRGALKDV